MKAWSVRLETNASREPSGDHCTSSSSPAPAMIFLAGAEPSTGTREIWLPLVNATTSLLGEITGASPSARSLGVPPANGTDQSWTLGGTGSDPGLGGGPSQLEPWSPPRTYTTHFPSAETAIEVSSWPSSRVQSVSRRAVKPGPSAPQTLRTPRSLNSQASFRPVAAAVRASG